MISKKSDKIYLEKDLKNGPSLILKNNFMEVELSEFENLNDIVKKEKCISRNYEKEKKSTNVIMKE
ncbi:MAG: hypothetical protein ACFFG0_42795 [Candidatus Thorarchaeota archaeon]